MTINGPPVVAKAGRTASNISRSGFRLVSSARQNATSSAITPTAVTPRMVRNDAGRHSMSTQLLRLIVSAVAQRGDEPYRDSRHHEPRPARRSGQHALQSLLLARLPP